MLAFLCVCVCFLCGLLENVIWPGAALSKVTYQKSMCYPTQLLLGKGPHWQLCFGGDTAFDRGSVCPSLPGYASSPGENVYKLGNSI